MPPHGHEINESQDDVWQRNKTTFRRLYLSERRTLKDVKRVMESEHDFPATPLSTYESKLRDLGLRKKMKRKDWYPIYQHYVNSGRRHTAIYFNETRIPWDKAWKEIRRSGARECNDGRILGLPTDVVMRSPSPVLIAQSATPSCYMVPIPWHLSDFSLVALSPSAMVHRLALYEIPSNLLRMDMLNSSQQLVTKFGKDSDKSSYDCGLLVSPIDLGIESTITQPSSLSLRNSKHSDIDIDKLSSALYRIANGDAMTLPGKLLDEYLDTVINRTPKYVLLKLIESDSPTIQAAFQRLAGFFYQLHRKDDFFTFIEAICLFHPKWILQHRLLNFAGRLGCVDSCRLILRTWHRLECNPCKGCIDAVLGSIQVGNVVCAKMIFEHVRESSTAPSQLENTLAVRIFWKFLSAVAENPLWELRIPAVSQMLEWFLETEANVDLPPTLTRRYYYVSSGSLSWYWLTFTPMKWKPTGLDYIYFINPELYSRLIDHSRQFQTDVTRSGAHHSAREGLDSLRAYLLSRLSHTPAEQDEFMEILLIEEFLRAEADDNWVDFNTLNTLFDYSLNLQKFRWKLSTSDMLCHIIKVARKHGMHPTVYYIVKTLIHTGAVIDADAIYESVESEGSTLLQLLLSYSADLKNQGAMALCEAMRLNNYEAVDRLLEGGANINATFKVLGSEPEATILSLANVYYKFGIPGTRAMRSRVRGSRPIKIMQCEMLKHLISRNLVLRESPADPDLRHLLYSIITSGLKFGSFVDTFDKIKVLLDAEPLEIDQPRAAPCVLEACFPEANFLDKSITLAQKLSLLHYLMSRGISAKHSGVLALLIRNRAPEDEIQRLLNSGVDINAYSGGRIQQTALQAAAYAGSLDWVRVLVQRGADVNRPAKGICGRTALQAACSIEPSQEGYSSKSHLIKFLIANGADVNAPPAAVVGVTAFQATALSGNFEHVLLLLDHGADINAPPSTDNGYCALDGSAAAGQLDMVKFLLNLGALSYDRGESGYRGAILCAEQSEEASPAIADMIRKHAQENGKSGEELSACQRHWDDSSESSDDWDDTDEESGIWSENQACWEDWLPL